MIRSLRVRLLLALMIVVVVALGTVAVLASQVTASELQRYAERDDERNRRLVDTVLTYYNQHANNRDAHAMARQLQQVAGERIVVTDGAGVVLADSTGALDGQTLQCEAPLAAVVVTFGPPPCVKFAPAGEAASPPMSVPLTRFEVAPPAGAGNILFIGAPLSGTLSMAPTAAEIVSADELWSRQASALQSPSLTVWRTRGQGLDPIETAFIMAVNRSLLLAVAAAGGVALLLTALISRRILGPIEALTAAARQMERGDLSARVPVRAQDELGALTRAFNAMADGLARLEELRRNMVADVAHELRTPLTNMRGYLEAVRDEVAVPDAAIIESMYEETMLLNRLADDLQELALAESGQLRLFRQPLVLGPVVERVVGALQAQLVARGMTVSVTAPADLSLVDADPERIGQVLRNLLQNAITHTPAGGAIAITITASTTEVAVCVRDTGGGIAPEHLPYIFERFYRGDWSRARATGGAGLGLTITKQLVEAHGGRIWAESTPGVGAAFTFTVPLMAS